MRCATALIFAIFVGQQPAAADSASDYRIRTSAGILEAHQALTPRLDGQREALGPGEVRVLCFAEGDVTALILRVDNRFYALNGTARDIATAADVEWRGAKHSIVDPYRSKLPSTDYMQRMIGPSNKACQR